MNNIERGEALAQAFNREFQAVVNGRPYTVHGSKLPIASIIKAWEYGFQRIVNDKCGGLDKTDADKDRIASATIARLLDGTIAMRRVGTASADPMDKWRDKAALALIQMRAPAVIKGLKGDERADAIDAWAGVNAAMVDKVAADMMKADAALRESIAAMTGDVAV